MKKLSEWDKAKIKIAKQHEREKIKGRAVPLQPTKRKSK